MAEPSEPLKVEGLDLQQKDGLAFLSEIPDGSVDLILTDPPYIISRETGMNSHYQEVKKQEEAGIVYIKTEEEWEKFRAEHNLVDDSKKENYRRYGTIYGKKYCVQTNYGSWDSEFTMEKLDEYLAQYYKKLRKGGTLIVFFDIWKITPLKELMEKRRFKQIRFLEWIKTNPQPLNSRVNYLTNCREIALLGVKGGKPTFNGQYDNAIYQHPLQGGKNRFHPTQKSLALFKELIEKHSKENDVVLDTFLGSGTTALACLETKRRCLGCEISGAYFEKMRGIVSKKATCQKATCQKATCQKAE